MQVITNNVPRQMVNYYDLPEEIQKEFGYVSECSMFDNRFVEYKGEWYDVFDSQCIATAKNGSSLGWAMEVDESSPLSKFTFIITESYFSGIVFKIKNDMDSVIVGRYCI